MKKIAFILLFCASNVYAQVDTTLSTKMTVFKEFCIRTANAAAVCNVDELTECIEGWVPAEYNANGTQTKKEKFVYKKEQIIYSPFSDFEVKDTLQEASINGHFRFIPAEVDNWIANRCEAVQIAAANILRDAGAHCEYVVRALKPRGKASYRTHGAGRIEMLAVTENGGEIVLSVDAVEKNYKSEIVNEVKLSDNKGGQSAQLVWQMTRNGEINFTVENMTDKEISFIVVKKM